MDNSTELNAPWEATSHSATQEIQSIYGTQRFFTMFTREPGLPILSQMNTVPRSYVSKVHFNIIPKTSS
jgi:hypothetical protein